MNLDMQWNKREQFLTIGYKQLGCWSIVRNEINHLRPKSGLKDIATTEKENSRPGVPYMPRTFPAGRWLITGIKAHPDKAHDDYLYPYFISTNAWQEVDEWSLTPGGFYNKPTGHKVKDYGYGLHFSSSVTTWGCIRITLEKDLRDLVDILRPALDRGDIINFQVTE
jgi:hypothetical protein